MGRKVIAIWLCLTMMLGFIVIVDEIVVEVIAYTPHDPFRINSNAEFASMAGIEGWIGDGSPGNPYIIQGYDINGSGYGYCIYIGNTTVNFEVRDSYLHDASGIGSSWHAYNSGISLINVQNGTITNNTASLNKYNGIFTYVCSSITITNNTISLNKNWGMSIYYSDSNTISDNNVSSNNWSGIFIQGSNNIISNNTVSLNKHGIDLFSSISNTIVHNTVSSNHDCGIKIFSSRNISVFNNEMLENGIKVEGVKLEYWDSHFIETSNTVNGKLVYYWKNQTSGIIPLDAGQVILVNCTNILVENLNVSNGTVGIALGYSNNNTIVNNTASSNNYYGIHLHISHDNTITNNMASSNRNNDIYYNFGHGIFLRSSDRNIITNNTASNNNNGFYFEGADENILANNSVWNNDNGIYLFSSRSITLVNTEMVDNSFNLQGIKVEYWNSHIINTSNTVNGKKVHYWKDQTEGTIPLDAGQVILANCTKVSIENQNVSDGTVGIILGFSNNNTIANNTAISNNVDGIFIYKSNKNTFINNTACSNNVNGINLAYSNSNTIVNNNASQNNNYGITLYNSDINSIVNNVFSFNAYGIHIYDSDSNNIFHNNMIGNINQAFDNSNNGNQWDSGYPSGGNYWSDYIDIDDYSGPDQDILGNDGIWDHNYSIDSDSKDRYPLVNPYIKDSIFLYQGWNLISIPFIQSDTHLRQVLSSIDDTYNIVQWLDATDHRDLWKHNSSLKPPHLNDFTDIDHTKGFWIYITEPGGVLLEYQGTQPTQNQTITLHQGWNMVGYPSLTSYNRTAGLNNLTFNTHVDAIWTYNSATQKYKEHTESDYFEIGKGYYIHAKEECTWVVPL